jgi:hypothetical protein
MAAFARGSGRGFSVRSRIDLDNDVFEYVDMSHKVQTTLESRLTFVLTLAAFSF